MLWIQCYEYFAREKRREKTKVLTQRKIQSNFICTQMPWCVIICCFLPVFLCLCVSRLAGNFNSKKAKRRCKRKEKEKTLSQSALHMDMKECAHFTFWEPVTYGRIHDDKMQLKASMASRNENMCYMNARVAVWVG